MVNVRIFPCSCATFLLLRATSGLVTTLLLLTAPGTQTEGVFKHSLHSIVLVFAYEIVFAAAVCLLVDLRLGRARCT